MKVKKSTLAPVCNFLFTNGSMEIFIARLPKYWKSMMTIITILNILNSCDLLVLVQEWFPIRIRVESVLGVIRQQNIHPCSFQIIIGCAGKLAKLDFTDNIFWKTNGPWSVGR